jgi:hypothetical protein
MRLAAARSPEADQLCSRTGRIGGRTAGVVAETFWRRRDITGMARMLKDAGGIPAHGNQRSEWDAGCRFDFDNPEYR